MSDKICKTEGCDNPVVELGPKELICITLPGTEIEIRAWDWGNPNLGDYCIECMEDSA